MSDMISKELTKVEDICIQDAPPACVAKCPVHVDARGMINAVRSGDFAGAYKLFSAVVPFPRIIAATCPRVCEGVCARASLGGALQIRALECACVKYGYKKSVLNKAFLPKRNEKIAVVGGGLSGLTAAYYLRRKGLHVDVYEKSDKLGGKLKDLLPQETIDDDISILFELDVNTLYNEEVKDVSEIESKYDAIYCATGTFDFSIESDTFYVRDNLFAGGSGRTEEYSSIVSLSDGKRAATSIERQLQQVSKSFGRENEGSYDTQFQVNADGVERKSPIAATSECFSKEEAIAESERCIDCRCEECTKGCTFLAYYKTNPKKFIREVRNCLAISVGNRFANEAINSCSECGFCGAVCPVGLDTGIVCADAKVKMVETNKMPPSAHDFALNDMAHSNGDDCALVKHQHGHSKSSYVFFPGCQIGATAPDIVKKTYADLCGRLSGGVGFISGCCGAIAKWAAQSELFSDSLNRLVSIWSEMGKPEVITACPTCYHVFSEHTPEIKISGIWDVFRESGLPAVARKPLTLAIHDACTTRKQATIHFTVRELLKEMGMVTEELKYSHELTQCCGYGGLTGFVNHELSDKTAEARITQSPSDFVVYCINCRDRFMANGKKAYHLLELCYGAQDGEIRKFSWSERRRNRENLKRELLNEFWGEKMEEHVDCEISFEGNTRKLIEKRMILLSDIRRVIMNAETTGKKLIDCETGNYIATRKVGKVMFWVWYKPTERGYAVHKAYSHRMKIEGM